MATSRGGCWDSWLDVALERLESSRLLRSLRPISINDQEDESKVETFDAPREWDRCAVEVDMKDTTIVEWLENASTVGGAACDNDQFATSGGVSALKKLLLFSGNDYLGLSMHPSVRRAAAKAADEVGMGPRGSALICGYTNYHRMLESALAKLKKKEECLLCPTGFAANMATIVSLGSVSSLLLGGRKPLQHERVAIFSDALNHASIIDGIRLAERLQEVRVYVYRHCDMNHLDVLLSTCTLEKKVVVTDSLFSMDGDFVPLLELTKLRKKHAFLLVIDDAHGTLVCGENGGGVAEMYDCEGEVDIVVGTLSKAAGCSGGFIACSRKWKQLIQSKGRSFIFSTALPIPIAAAAYASVVVGKKEKWRRRRIWSLVDAFSTYTQISISSPIISYVVGNEEMSLLASRHLLKSGFHVTAIRPPTVPANSCRLRITLCAVHTREDVKKLADALSFCSRFLFGSNDIRGESLLSSLHKEIDEADSDFVRSKL